MEKLQKKNVHVRTVNNQKEDLKKKRKFRPKKRSIFTKLLYAIKDFFRSIFGRKKGDKRRFVGKSHDGKRIGERKGKFDHRQISKETFKNEERSSQKKSFYPQQQKVKSPILGTVNYVTAQFAFIIPENSKDNKDNIYVKKIDLKGALHGDTVRVVTINERWRSYEVGFVKEIVKRANDFFVGTLCRKNESYYVIPNGGKFYLNVNVTEKNVKQAQAFIDSRVKVKITKYPQGDDVIEGEIVKVLGKVLDHETETNALLEEFNVRSKFEQPVLDYVENIEDKIPQSEYERRVDYRSVFTLTIDPVTAKDFDDALSIQKIPNGHYEIGVHIADVSFYVKEGSVLDEEAYQRNTSIYLIDRTIPMLPDCGSPFFYLIKP